MSQRQEDEEVGRLLRELNVAVLAPDGYGGVLVMSLDEKFSYGPTTVAALRALRDKIKDEK